MRCPIKRAIRKDGWVVKATGRRDTAALLGSAFAAGVGVYNNLRQVTESNGEKMPPRMATASREKYIDASFSVAAGVIGTRLYEWERNGIVTDSGGDDVTIPKITARVNHALTKYILNDPIPDTWKLVSIEESLGPEYGNARPDMIIRDDHGLAVFDYKTKLTLLAQYRAKTIMEYANAHQMLHYAWAVGDKYRETVGNYYIGLAVFEPRWAFDKYVYPVHPETLLTWREGMDVVWENMTAEDHDMQPPYMSANHSDNFGQCEYYKACFHYHYDSELMKQDYIQLKGD